MIKYNKQSKSHFFDKRLVFFAATEAPKPEQAGPENGKDQSDPKADQEKLQQELKTRVEKTSDSISKAQSSPNPAIQEAAKVAREKLTKLQSNDTIAEIQKNLAEVGRILDYFETTFPAYSQESQKLQQEAEAAIKSKQAAVVDNLNLFKDSHPNLNKNVLFLFNRLQQETQMTIANSIQDTLLQVNQKPSAGADLDSYAEQIQFSLNAIKRAPDDINQNLASIFVDHDAKRDAIVIDYAAKQKEQGLAYMNTEASLALTAIDNSKSPEKESIKQDLAKLLENSSKLSDLAKDDAARAMILAEFNSAKTSLVAKAKGENPPTGSTNLINEVAKRYKISDAITLSSIQNGFIISTSDRLNDFAKDQKQFKLNGGNVEFRSETSATVLTLLTGNTKVKLLNNQVVEIKTGEKYPPFVDQDGNIQTGLEKTRIYYKVETSTGLVGLVPADKIDMPVRMGTTTLDKSPQKNPEKSSGLNS